MPCRGIVEAKGKRVQAGKSVLFGQMMLRLHKHGARVSCGLGNAQRFEDLCAVSVEGRQ